MHPSVTLEDIQRRLSKFSPPSRFTLIVLSRPGSKFWIEEVGPNIDYLHLRSGSNLQCFLAGVSAYGGDMPDAVPIPSLWDRNAHFSMIRFVQMVESIEERMRRAGLDYRYLGGADVHVVSLDSDGNLDFANCIAIDAENFVRVGAIPSFVHLVERLCEFQIEDNGDPREFARIQAANDPVTQLARCVVSFFNLGSDSFDRRREWLRCSIQQRK